MQTRHDPEPALLELMRVLEEHPEYTQRQLSQAVGVSLGKTHYLLKALLEKGLVKAQNFRRNDNKLAYVYALTPTGVGERLRMTQDFLTTKEREFSMLKTQIAMLRNELAQRADS